MTEANAKSWDLRGRTCVVTGATSGIGTETALGLARLGAHVTLVGRNRARGESAVARIRNEHPDASLRLHLADLSSQHEIRRLAEEVLATHSAIHVLVNNAGIVNLKRRTTRDGIEETFAVNHLGYFLLTRLLLDRLRASAPARIVSVSSDAHKFGPLDPRDLQNERRYRSMRVYGQSKTANLLFTREMARRLEGSGVTAHALHPGAVSTRLGQQNGPLARVLTGVLGWFFLSPAEGAATSIYLASDRAVGETNGGYWYRKRPHEMAGHARDDALAAHLWDESERLCGLAPGA